MIKKILLSLIFVGFCVHIAANDDVTKMIREGLSLLAAKKHQAGKEQMRLAVERLQTLLKKDANNTKLYCQLSRAYSYLGNHDMAFANIDKAIELDPRNAEYHFKKMLLLLRARHKRDLLIRELKIAHELDPKNVKYIWSIAALYRTDKNFVAAKEFYQKVLQINPNHTNTLYHLGTLKLSENKFDEALELLLRTIKIDPTHVEAYCSAGQIYEDMGKYHLAIEMFQAVYRLDSKNWRSLEKLARLHGALGDLDKNEQYHLKILDYKEQGLIEELNKVDSYTRDQYTLGDYKISTSYYFKLTSKQLARYVFHIHHNKKLFCISFGMHNPATKIDKIPTVFYLDGDYPDGSHKIFEIFVNNHPSYKEIKRMVDDILMNKKKALSDGKTQGRRVK